MSKNTTQNSQKKFKTYWSANPFKIYSHIPKLHDWYMGKDIYPISIEIGLTSHCNHRCTWCSINAKEIDRTSYLENNVIDNFVLNISEMDVRSVVVSGSGEQTLHPYFRECLRQLKKANIYIGLNTNGSKLTEELCETITDCVTWVRTSLDASSEAVRKNVHGVKDLHKAIAGLNNLVSLKKKTGSMISIGTQMVICPENEMEIESCAELSKSIGVDYQQIKPTIPFDYYYPDLKDEKQRMSQWLDRVKSVADNLPENGFMINVRYDQFQDYINGTDLREKAHLPCMTSFSPYVEADGQVWYCVDKKGNKNYWLGNLNETSLVDIWRNDRRKEVLAYVKHNPCGHICRNSPLNEFLWEMKNPTPFYSFL
jgi:cyclic pyranopterin phosphate synthase